ncbi:MAG: hypothetical protein LUG16_03255 [Candidatus Gastranaerophilales bacterium]|nr:hypothetical protein [Candidatus Gastranaerophilales bacterium]
MEENNNYNNENEKHVCFEKHCWKKCLAMLCAAFLGGFLAFYFVADQMAYKYHQDYFNPKKFEKRMMNDMDRMYKRDMKAFDDAFKMHDKMVKPEKHDKKQKFKRDNIDMPDFMSNSVRVKTEFEDNIYKVIIGLRPFEENENKVNYNVNGRKLTVFGNSDVKDKGFEQQISFSQDFILPENADIANIKKEKDGDKLIISVAVKV